MRSRSMVRVGLVVVLVAASLATNGCTFLRPSTECGPGGGCAPTVPVATSDRARLPTTAAVGSPVLGTLASSFSSGKACFRLLRPNAAPVFLAFPPGTVATPGGPSKQLRDGYTLIGQVVGGVGAGQRVAVAPDAVERSTTIDGCPTGTVWYTGTVALVSRAPGAVAARCDQAVSAPLDCRSYASVRGFDPARSVSWFGRAPVRMRVRGIGGIRTAEVEAPTGTIRVPLRLDALGAESDGASTLPSSPCAPRTSLRCVEDAWLRGFFGHRVRWASTPQHPEAVTLHGDGRRAIDFRVQP